MNHKIKRCGLNLSDSGKVQSSYVWRNLVTLCFPRCQDLLQKLIEYQLLNKLNGQTCHEFNRKTYWKYWKVGFKLQRYGASVS
jgi:hypothetical protein